MSEIFDLCDLDSDGLLNRSEFNWFQMMLSDEDIDDESWQVVLGERIISNINFNSSEKNVLIEAFLS